MSENDLTGIKEAIGSFKPYKAKTLLIKGLRFIVVRLTLCKATSVHFTGSRLSPELQK
ncbi:hypothetical protein ACIFQM_03990 [Paenibacillus sp. NRS-1782]|uniref:hypothetical protein n=1 Tax=unclassified Paenibacillus TaxID=185978 RepID=UPI003D2AE729